MSAIRVLSIFRQFFQNLNREEAALDLKMKMNHFKNREPAQFTFTETGEKMGTALLNTYNADLNSRNLGMKELRRLERIKAGLGNLSTKYRLWDRFFSPELESRQVPLDRLFSGLYFRQDSRKWLKDRKQGLKQVVRQNRNP